MADTMVNTTEITRRVQMMCKAAWTRRAALLTGSLTDDAMLSKHNHLLTILSPQRTPPKNRQKGLLEPTLRETCEGV